ncbi:MAG: hypothetical protein JKX73_09975 [Flavobacteriales bacterium]|nr:hypothetical protein [Flavobacteriales bacterium]
MGVGLLLLVLIEIIKSKKRWGASWSARKYFTNNIPQFGVGIISSYAMFYFAEQFTEGVMGVKIDPSSTYYTWFALACGFNGHVLVGKLKNSSSKSP